jgi:hypothetical protein
MRDIMDAIFYGPRPGCGGAWYRTALPRARRFTGGSSGLREEGVFETINHHLLIRDRERVGREASPRAAVLNSQSVKTTDAGGPRGGARPRERQSRDPWDAGEKMKGRKPYALVDTD